MQQSPEKEARATAIREGTKGSAPNARQTAAESTSAPAKALTAARSQLFKEAQRVARLKRMKVSEVVDRAAKGSFAYSNLQRLTAKDLPAIKAATDVLRRIA